MWFPYRLRLILSKNSFPLSIPVGIDTTLVVDPALQNPILAESNIARYIFRVLNPAYDSVENLPQFVANDKWLNLASRSLVYGNAKERQSAVRQLNSHLGKSSFLTGSQVSLVDAVVVSGLFQAKEYGNAGGNVKKWIQACHETELFYGMKEFLAWFNHVLLVNWWKEEENCSNFCNSVLDFLLASWTDWKREWDAQSCWGWFKRVMIIW